MNKVKFAWIDGNCKVDITKEGYGKLLEEFMNNELTEWQRINTKIIYLGHDRFLVQYWEQIKE